MADERGATIIGGIEAEVRALRQDVTELKVDVAEVKGELRQMDKRIGDLASQMDKRMATLERLLQWMLGILVTSWFTTVGLIIAKLK